MRKLILILLIIILPIYFGNMSYYNVEDIMTYEYETEFVVAYENLTGTVYHPVREQTDDTPLITADLYNINLNTLNDERVVALSRNLINQQDSVRKWYGKIPFGTVILVESPYEDLNGFWVVHDTMNKRYTNNIDFMQNHKDPSSIYGKWENITIKFPIIKKKSILTQD